MKLPLKSASAALAALLFANCSEPDSPPLARYDVGPGIGPFDSRGNYREEWADDPSKWRRPGSVARYDAPPANANPLPPAPASNSRPSASTVRPSPSATTTPSRPSVSSTASNPPPRPRPTVTRYTVKRGDTLSSIASRHRCSLTALRQANKISGHLIHPGQRLVIPSR